MGNKIFWKHQPLGISLQQLVAKNVTKHLKPIRVGMRVKGYSGDYYEYEGSKRVIPGHWLYGTITSYTPGSRKVQITWDYLPWHDGRNVPTWGWASGYGVGFIPMES